MENTSKYYDPQNLHGTYDAENNIHIIEVAAGVTLKLTHNQAMGLRNRLQLSLNDEWDVNNKRPFSDEDFTNEGEYEDFD